MRGILSAITVFLVLFLSATVALAGTEKVTFCHAAGQDGTIKYVTLTTSWNAAFGQAGHFNENGTTRAGHEDDYLGECESTTTTTTPATSVPSSTIPVTTIPVDSTTTSTTVMDTTTTTSSPPESTTTTTEPPSPTTTVNPVTSSTTVSPSVPTSIVWPVRPAPRPVPSREVTTPSPTPPAPKELPRTGLADNLMLALAGTALIAGGAKLTKAGR